MEWIALAFFCVVVLVAFIDVFSAERRLDRTTWGIHEAQPPSRGEQGPGQKG